MSKVVENPDVMGDRRHGSALNLTVTTLAQTRGAPESQGEFRRTSNWLLKSAGLVAIWGISGLALPVPLAVLPVTFWIAMTILAWLHACWLPLAVLYLSWPFLVRAFPRLESRGPMLIALSTASLGAAVYGALRTFGTITSTIELAIPFAVCWLTLALPRILLPPLHPGAFASHT